MEQHGQGDRDAMETLAGLSLLQPPSKQAGGFLSTHIPTILYAWRSPLNLGFLFQVLAMPQFKSIKWKISELNNSHVFKCMWP